MIPGCVCYYEVVVTGMLIRYSSVTIQFPFSIHNKTLSNVSKWKRFHVVQIEIQDMTSQCLPIRTQRERWRQKPMRGRENSRKTSGFDTKCLPQIHPKNDSHQPTTPTTQIAHTHHINHHQSPPKNQPSLFLSHRPKYISTISLDWPTQINLAIDLPWPNTTLSSWHVSTLIQTCYSSAE